MADLMKTPGHADPLKVKNQEHVKKIISERMCLFFEGMDILAGLMENLLEPWRHNGYKDIICGVSSHKPHLGEETQKHIHVGEERAGWFTLIA